MPESIWRETLQARFNGQRGLVATVVVTHHVEEIAPGTTHALVLLSGRVVAAGPVDETVTGPVLTEAFGRRYECSVSAVGSQLWPPTHEFAGPSLIKHRSVDCRLRGTHSPTSTTISDRVGLGKILTDIWRSERN